jgi:hypothetical protein
MNRATHDEFAAGSASIEDEFVRFASEVLASAGPRIAIGKPAIT